MLSIRFLHILSIKYPYYNKAAYDNYVVLKITRPHICQLFINFNCYKLNIWIVNNLINAIGG